MNILYMVHQFYPEYWTGTEKFVLKTSSMMQKAGHRVRVVTYALRDEYSFDETMDNILWREFTYNGIEVIALRHKRIPNDLHISLGDDSMTSAAKHVLSLEKPDIIHIGHAMRVGEVAVVARSLGIPYIMTLTDFWMICPKYNLVNSRGDLCQGPGDGRVCAESCPELPSDFISKRLATARDFLFGATSVISPSEFLAAIFRKEVPGLSVKVINHGLSYNTIRRNNRSYRKGDRLAFCYAGSLNHHKGVHVLIEAFKEIRSRDVVLKIFGSGPDQTYVNSLFDLARGDTRIEFHDAFQEEDVGGILSSVDVIIVPSLWYENYPLILHEALACHTPALVSNAGGMSEKVKNGVNGFTFSLGDRDELRVAIERIIDNPVILNDIKENLKSFMVPTIEQESYAYHELYTDILKR
ncbi:MAG: glycosyltransferase [Dehalococcoidia bacterium]